MKLGELTHEQAHTIRRWRNDDRRFWRTPYLLTEAMQDEWFYHITRRDSKHRYFAIYDGVFIGGGGLMNIDWPNSRAEISLVLDPEINSVEYRIAATYLLLEEAFDRMGLETVDGEVYDCANVEMSHEVMDYFNAYSAPLVNRKRWNGVLWDSTYFAYTRGEFGALRSKQHR
jgi:RimJ/RimL family protein N-acetyltransferase